VGALFLGREGSVAAAVSALLKPKFMHPFLLAKIGRGRCTNKGLKDGIDDYDFIKLEPWLVGIGAYTGRMGSVHLKEYHTVRTDMVGDDKGHADWGGGSRDVPVGGDGARRHGIRVEVRCL